MDEDEAGDAVDAAAETGVVAALAADARLRRGLLATGVAGNCVRADAVARWPFDLPMARATWHDY